MDEIAVNDLIPYANNSRTHSEEQVIQIASSIKEFGFLNPVIIDEQNGLIAGHGRVMAAKKLGLESIPFVRAEGLTEAQKKAYVIADNQLALNADWDLDKLKLEVNNLIELDFDTDLLGFDTGFIDGLLDDTEPVEGLTGDDDIPEIPEQAVTVSGDIWVLGNHRLMCGDSTSIDAVESLMDGKKADMVFTDPTYNQETKGGFKGEIGKALEKQSGDIEHLCNFNPAEFLQVLPILFNKTMNAYIFTSKDLLPEYLSWAKDNKYAFNLLVWKKPNAIPIGGSHRPDIEYLLLFRRSGIFNGGIKGVDYSKCLEFPREKEGYHPTMKPVAMLENQINIGSNKRSNVFDLFGGSGSTVIACEKTNRNCFMMELDEKYCDVIINRWQDFTGKQATLESTGETYQELKGKREAA